MSASIEKPQSPEAIWLFAGPAFDYAVLSIVAEGKSVRFALDRRQIMGLAEQVYGALKNMEMER